MSFSGSDTCIPYDRKFLGQLEKQGTGNGNGNGNGKRERERTTDGAQNGIDKVENALINVRSHVPFTAVTFRIAFQCHFLTEKLKAGKESTRS